MANQCRWRALAAIAAALVVLAPSSARADTPEASGYWWQGGLLAQRPPVIPEGGLWVATAFGRVAFTTVRGAGGASPSLTLRIASSTGFDDDPTGIAVVSVVACPVTSPWELVPAGGSLDDAPSFDCDETSAPGVVDGDSLRFDLTELTGDGRFDVAIVPSPAVEAERSFSLVFEAPDDGAIAEQQLPATGGTGQAPSTPTTTPASAPFDPPAPGLPLPDLPVVQPPRLPQASGTSQAPVALPAAHPLTPLAGHRDPWALAVGSAVIGAWVWRARRAAAASGLHPLATSFRLSSDHADASPSSLALDRS